MKIQKIDTSASFKAVNEKYLERAKNQFFAAGKVLPDLFQSMSYDVFKHKKLPHKDTRLQHRLSNKNTSWKALKTLKKIPFSTLSTPTNNTITTI